MKLRVFALCMSLLFGMGITSAAQASDDYFDTGALDGSTWTFVDPVGDGTLSFDATHAIISVPQGSSHDVWTGGNFAPRIMRPAADDDMSIEVKIDSPIDQRYKLQGIVVEQDASNFLRFDFYSNDSGAIAFAASFANGSPTVRANLPLAIQTAPLFIRIERAGDTWTHEYSVDGSNWSQLVSFSYGLSVTQVGIYAGNAGPSPAHSAEFDYFLFDQSGAPLEYTVSTNTAGQGTVSINPNQPTYPAGTPIELTATPNLGWSFDGWSGDIAGVDNPIDVNVNQNLNVTANFVTAPAIDVLAITENRVDLVWTVFSGSPVDYEVFRDGVSIGTTDQTRFTDTASVSAGAQYEIRARYADTSTQSEFQTLAAAVDFAAAPWWDLNWANRELVTAYSSVARTDDIFNIEFDVTNQIANSDGAELDLASIRCHEVDVAGAVVSLNVPCQFDPAADFDAISNIAGQLLIYLSGVTNPNTARYYHVYFDAEDGSDKAFAYTPLVSVADTFDEDQDAFSVTNLTGEYIYHKAGAGFSSIIDLDGNDWVGYAPTGGSAGNYRGVPNLVYPAGLFHPGSTTGTTTLQHSGPVQATLLSESADGNWTMRVTFQPQKVVMDLLNTNGNYWFLYEGTPGGALDLTTDFTLLPDGTLRPLQQSWLADILNPMDDTEWVAFLDTVVGRSFIVLKDSDDLTEDTYSPMNNEMTVFGFGRNNLNTLLTQEPAQFQLSLVESSDATAVANVANAVHLAATTYSTTFEPPALEDRYTLNTSTVGQGSVTATPDLPNYVAGDNVSLMATPQAGWSFTGWSGDLSSTDNPLSVAMNSDVTVTANFEADGVTYAVTTAVVGNGQVQLNPTGGVYSDGTSVQALAVPDAGWSFSNWIGFGSTNPLTITVDQDFSLTAEFDQDPIIPQISNVQATAQTDAAAITWQTDIPTTGVLRYGTSVAVAGGIANTSSNTSHSANLSGLVADTLYYYEITVTSSEGETAVTNGTFSTQAESAGGDYFDGGSLDPIWTFVDPRGDSTLSFDSSHAIITVPAGSSHDIWTSGNFAARIMRPVNDEDFVLETKFDSDITQAFQLQGILVEQDANSFLRFDFYTDGSNVRGFAASFTNGSPSVRNDQPLGALTAPLYLRVEREGDVWSQSYSVDGENWNLLTSFSYGMSAASVGVFAGNAGASPAHSARVDYFLINDGGAPPPPPPETYTLTTSVSGQGSLQRTPDSATYTEGDSVSLDATAAQGWLFNGWSGDVISGDNPLVLTMNQDLNVVANFVEENLPTYELSTSVTGNGQIQLSPAGGTYIEGTIVQATAVADAGWLFDGWNGTPATDNPRNVTMNGDVALTATFVNQPPTAAVNVDATSGFYPLTVNFDGTASSDAGGAIVSWAWDFGDGAMDNSGAQVSHVYTATGVYTATLTVTDDQGATDTATVNIDVSSDNITVSAITTPTPGTLEVAFDGSGSSVNTGSIVAYDWAFGDGTSANGVSVVHTYASAGNYTFTLTITDSAGDEATFSQTLRVTDSLSNRVDDGLIALYEMSEGTGTTIADTSSNGVPLNLQIEDSGDVTWLSGGLRVDASAGIRTAGPATKIIDAVGSSNALTVEAWIRTDDLGQNGPARIVSISGNPSTRNLTLGQGVFNGGGDRFEVRARTTGTSNNGTPAANTPNGTLTTELHHVVYTINAAGDAFVYVDGVLQGSRQVGGNLSNWDASYALNFANEQTGDRPWLGELHLVAFYDKALEQLEITQNFDAGPDGDGVVVRNFAVNSAVVGQGTVSKDPDLGSHAEGSTVTLTASPAVGWSFDNWSGDVASSSNPLVVTVAQNTNVTATFTQDPLPEFNVTTSVVGSGQVNLNPAGGVYMQGTTIQAEAVADLGWEFSQWVGLGSSENPLSVTVNGNVALTAEFANQAPSAAISTDVTVGLAPLTVTFDGSGSSDTGGYITDWSWNFGDGNTATGSNVSHQYTDTGVFTVTLTVTDNLGATATAEQAITVSSENIVADASVSAVPGSLQANFDGSGSSVTVGTIAAWDWDFGDGNSASGAQVSHTYAATGTYNYTLTVTDSLGATGTFEGSVQVTEVVVERVTNGLVALYELNEQVGTAINDTAASGAPLNLSIFDQADVTWIDGGLRVDTSTEIRSPGPATKIIDAGKASSEFTVEAWVKTSDINQTGPARMVSMSGGPTTRNFTLGQGVGGQSGDRIEVRTRTTSTSANGTPATRTDAGTFSTDLQHLVYTFDTDGNSAIYINGSRQSVGDINGNLSNWDDSFALHLANEQSGDRPWLGEIYLVAFYDRVLSNQEAAQNYAAGSEGNGIGIDLPPYAVATVDSVGALVPANASFDASDSFDADGTVVSYAWDFGDGNSANGVTASHTYLTPGNYTVTLTVTDNGGTASSTTLDYEAVDPATVPALVVFDWDGPVEQSDSGFAFDLPPIENGNWEAPINYSDGTFYIRAEMKSMPVIKNMYVQFCLWQYNFTLETCTTQYFFNGSPGNVITTSQAISSMWVKNGVPMDWANPRQRSGMAIKNEAQLPVSDFVGWNWHGEDPTEWFPMDIRYTVVLVPPGGTFAGWDAYIN